MTGIIRAEEAANSHLQLLTSSLDGSLRSFSCSRDTKVENLGYARRLSKKKAKSLRLDDDDENVRLPPVVSFVGTHLGGPAEWDNLLCRHKVLSMSIVFPSLLPTFRYTVL